ncbi:MAG: phosphatase PAP2 family protein [candidate division KSB1 bacterium]|nr:phosphatase PAP2 family protein [candidate division KSB1 bacterium]MDZ7368294.1 phosphatase PAP2 family protein [candidate division KSB1 bacterium]MDZ7406126.1 phosphatase PAP2 family protein [candidate division KSB1 bacterium]
MKLSVSTTPAFFLLTFFAGQPLLAQGPTFTSGDSAMVLQNLAPRSTAERFNLDEKRFYENLYEGAKMSFQRRDLLGLAASAFLDQQRPGQGLELPPLEVDEEITESLARNDGKKSLGALSPVYYPGLFATSRLAGMMLLDAVNLHDYAAATYAKMFRFHQALYYTKVVTRLSKRNIHRYRPDGSDTYSFFSGHTSAAFATSTFLYLEARDFIDGFTTRGDETLPLMSPKAWKRLSFGVLYGWAGYVGFSRIHDKKHYLSDVVAGAVSGTLVSYWLYPHQEKNNTLQIGIQPMYHGASMAMEFRF